MVTSNKDKHVMHGFLDDLSYKRIIVYMIFIA